MSPRAAWRLERYGFEVYDYTLGKVDWLAAGLPTIRTQPAPMRVFDALDTMVEACGPDDIVADVTSRTAADECLVVNSDRILLGRLRLGADTDPNSTAEVAMHPGPTTVRAHENLGETLARMRARAVPTLVVTTAQGELLGVIHAEP